MDFPVSTPSQLTAVLRALRKSRGLSQATLGKRLGVNQKRIARIEAMPGVTSFDQIARYTSALGARLVIQDPNDPKSPTAEKAKSAGGDTW